MKFTAKELRDWDCTKLSHKHECWVLARPINLTPLWARLRHAWGVLVGRYDVVEWDE